MLIGWSDAPQEDCIRAFTQLFELGNPEVDFIAERLLSKAAPAPGQVSVFRPALEHANGVSKSRLIDYIFTRQPVEATEWFANNVELSETERRQVITELPAMKSMANPPKRLPGQPAPSQLLSEDEKDRKTQEWLIGQSWILQLFAKSYLTKYSGRQTPEFQAAMSKVTVPTNVKLRTDNSDLRLKQQGSQESEPPPNQNPPK